MWVYVLFCARERQGKEIFRHTYSVKYVYSSAVEQLTADLHFIDLPVAFTRRDIKIMHTESTAENQGSKVHCHGQS